MKKASIILLLVACHGFLLSAVGGCDSRSIGIDGNCGNGVVDPGEECDDGNRIALDGCGETCLLETSVVLVLLDSRGPYTLRSVRIGRDGTLDLQDKYLLGQEASNVVELNKKFESVVACGHHLYVAVEWSGKIVHLTVDSQGLFTKIKASRCVKAHSLACDCEAGLLFATSRHSASAYSPLALHTYSLGDEGRLVKIGEMSIWPEGPSSEVEPFWALALQHSLLIRPGTNNLWLTASFNEISTGSPCRSWRFAYSDRGNLSVREASRSIFYRYVGGAASFSPDGTKYFMPKLNNRCFAWVDVANQVNLPHKEDVNYWCTGDAIETYSLTVDPEGHLYYYLEQGEVSRARVGQHSMQTVDRFTSPGEGEGFLKLLFGGEILLMIGFDGNLFTLAVDEGEENATLLDSMELGEGSLRLGSTALIAHPNP